MTPVRHNTLKAFRVKTAQHRFSFFFLLWPRKLHVVYQPSLSQRCLHYQWYNSTCYPESIHFSNMPSISSTQQQFVASRSSCRRGSRTTTMRLNPRQRRRIAPIGAFSKLHNEFTKNAGKNNNGPKLRNVDHPSSSCSALHVQQPLDQQHVSSKAIPLPKAHIRRTLSEEDLKEGAAIAELHDVHMFKRLIQGIEEQNKTSSARTSGSISSGQHNPSVDDYLAGVRNSKTIDSIVRSRNASFTELDNLSSSCFAAEESKRIPWARTGHINVRESSSQQRAVLQDVLQMACEISLEPRLPSSAESLHVDPNQDYPEEGIFIMDDP